MRLLSLLLPLLPSLLSLLPAQQAAARAMARRAARRAALGGIAFFLVVIAVGFGIAGLYMALAAAIGPAEAAALVALLLLLVAAILMLTLLALDRRPARQAPPEGEEQAGPVVQLARQVEANPVASVAVAALLGTLLGRIGRDK